MPLRIENVAEELVRDNRTDDDERSQDHEVDPPERRIGPGLDGRGPGATNAGTRELEKPREDDGEREQQNYHTPHVPQRALWNAERHEQLARNLDDNPCSHNVDTGGTKHAPPPQFYREVLQSLHAHPIEPACNDASGLSISLAAHEAPSGGGQWQGHVPRLILNTAGSRE